MATAILKEIFDIEIIRTRNNEILNGLDLVFDVGGGEFDHHDVEKQYRETGTPYAACGLIWRRFGREVVKSIEPSLEEKDIEDIFRYTDATLIEGIDAIDNGLRTSETIVRTMNISSMIAEFNTTWDEDASQEAAFYDAVDFATSALRNTIHQKISVIKAGEFVRKAFDNRIRPELLILDGPYPWTRALSEIDTEKEVLFVIYPRDGQYLIQTVRERGSGRKDRKSLPKAWAGKRDKALCEVIGADDAVFCHPARFIAGAKSMESILKMADIAIAEREEQVERGFIKALRKFLLSRRVVIRR